MAVVKSLLRKHNHSLNSIVIFKNKMKNKIKIIAIGGGEIGRPGHSIETEAIDREILTLTEKKHPKVLLLPTASGDSELYWNTFSKYYGKKLKCKTDVLYLLKEKYTKKHIREKILGSDVIYVGGGNTLRMLKRWRKLGVDQVLVKAGKNGTILSGLSAGAICWFKYGNSDSLKFGKSKSKQLIRIRGIGLINLMVCPHYDVEKNRRSSLKKMIKQKGNIVIALTNCSAIEIIDDTYRIITSSKEAKAYRLYRKNKKVIEEKLAIENTFKPLKELM